MANYRKLIKPASPSDGWSMARLPIVLKC